MFTDLEWVFFEIEGKLTRKRQGEGEYFSLGRDPPLLGGATPPPPYSRSAPRRKRTRSGLKWRVWSDLIWSPRSDLIWPRQTPLGEIFRPNLAPRIDQNRPRSKKNRCQDGVFFRHHFKIDFWSTWAPNLDPLIRQNVGFSLRKITFFWTNRF